MASVTDMVPMADERRPEKGNTSGDRPHWVLIFTLPTTVDSISSSGAASLESVVKMDACCPKGILAI